MYVFIYYKFIYLLYTNNVAHYVCLDKRHVLLTSFSIYTNGKNLLKTDRHRDSIKCLDGLRCISICWIIYGHTHYIEVVGVKMNLSEIPQVKKL